MAVLWFNGVAMPDPALNGVTIKREKIWSKKTGRAANGEMLGTVIAIKDTVSIKWPPLTHAQTALIDSFCSLDFFTVSYIDPASGGATKTVTVYAGTPSYPVYTYVNGIKSYHGVAVDLIGK